MKRKMHFTRKKLWKAAAAALSACFITSASAAPILAEDLVNMEQDTGESETVKKIGRAHV